MKNKDQILLEKLYLEGLYSSDTDDEIEEDEMEPLYIRGEYWFDEYGDTMYADGDYGDIEQTTSASTQQVRQMDTQQTPSFYKGQLGDSYIPSFGEYFQLIEKKEKRDRCLKKADSVYGKKTSAYKSGSIVRCRQGKIWKKKK